MKTGRMNKMKTRELTVACEHGLHLRVAAEVVKRVVKQDSTVHIHCKDCPRANACSILELLLLGAENGTEIQITAEGNDEDTILNSLTEVFSEGGGI